MKASSSVVLEGINLTRNQVPQALATTRVPAAWTGPRVVTFFPENLPEPLQLMLYARGLPPQQVQGGRLVQEEVNLSSWTLELSVLLSEIEGEGIFFLWLTDRSKSPGWVWQMRRTGGEEQCKGVVTSALGSTAEDSTLLLIPLVIPASKLILFRFNT